MAVLEFQDLGSESRFRMHFAHYPLRNHVWFLFAVLTSLFGVYPTLFAENKAPALQSVLFDHQSPDGAAESGHWTVRSAVTPTPDSRSSTSLESRTDGLVFGFQSKQGIDATRTHPAPRESNWNVLDVNVESSHSIRLHVSFQPGPESKLSEVETEMHALPAGKYKLLIAIPDAYQPKDHLRFHVLPEPDAPVETVRLIVQRMEFTSMDGTVVWLRSSWLFPYLKQYGYVAFFLAFMAISFGVPLPEELFHLSAGYLAWMTDKEPEIGINVHVIAAVNYISTIGGDCFVYLLARWKGKQVLEWRWFKKVIPEKALGRVQKWFTKYGMWAVFFFRFLPPIRMPGYFTAGLMRLPFWKFIVANGLAGLLSIPTQIYCVYYFGDQIIGTIKALNFYALVVLGSLATLYVLYEVFKFFFGRKPDLGGEPANTLEGSDSKGQPE